MRFVCFALLLSAVAISAEDIFIRPALWVNKEFISENQGFQDLVSYLQYHMSPSDIDDILAIIPEALADQDENLTDAEQFVQVDDVEAMPRSLSIAIPWHKIVDYVEKAANSNSKFSKVLNLVNDPKFRDLVKRAVNSHTLAEFVKDVAEHGFRWTEFLHLLLHALCSAATTIQHDRYSVGVCQVLQNL